MYHCLNASQIDFARAERREQNWFFFLEFWIFLTLLEPRGFSEKKKITRQKIYSFAVKQVVFRVQMSPYSTYLAVFVRFRTGANKMGYQGSVYKVRSSSVFLCSGVNDLESRAWLAQTFSRLRLIKFGTFVCCLLFLFFSFEHCLQVHSPKFHW